MSNSVNNRFGGNNRRSQPNRRNKNNNRATQRNVPKLSLYPYQPGWSPVQMCQYPNNVSYYQVPYGAYYPGVSPVSPFSMEFGSPSSFNEFYFQDPIQFFPNNFPQYDSNLVQDLSSLPSSSTISPSIPEVVPEENMKSEPDPNSRSGTNAASSSSGQNKPLLYSKALSSSLPPPPNVAPPATCSPLSPSQQPVNPSAPHHLQHANTAGQQMSGHNASGKQNSYPRNNNGPGRSGGNKHNGDNNHGRNQQKFWNNNGNNGPDNSGDHQTQKDQSPQYISSPNGNSQFPSHSGVGIAGDHGGRKSANGNAHGFQAHGGGDGGSYGHGHGQHQQQQQPHHHNYNNGGQNPMNGRGDHRQNSGKDYEMSTTNLYISGLKAETTDDDLMTLCSLYGPITTTKAILDHSTNKCRGFGFVDFQDPHSAELAIANLKFQGVQAQMARCSEAKRNKMNVVNTPSETDPTNLYIANLPPQMNEKDLETMLSSYGTVTSTRILKDIHGVSRCVGFARMENREMCDHIIRVFKDKVLPGSNEVLMVKYADGGAKKKNFKNNGGRYQNDDSQRPMNDSGGMATNGVSQMLPNQMNGAANFPNMASFNPFIGLSMGMHPVNASQYQQGAPGAGQQLYGPHAAAQLAYGQMNDPSMHMANMQHLIGQMSQMNINNGYPYGQYMYGMPPPPQVAPNVDTDPNVQASIDVVTGQQVAGNPDGQPGQADGFVHAPPPPGPNQAALAAAMLYSQQAQN